MAMIRVELNQSLVRGGQCLPLADVDRVCRAVARALGLTKDVRVSVAFVSEADIKRLNAQYRGKNKVTDVLSFNLDEGELLGEILLCYPQARRQAQELRHGVREELLFLLVHGLLHLHGFDHETARDAQRMFPIQKRILDGLSIDSRL